MTLVRRPSPLGELLSLRQAMDRLYDISSTADALVVEAPLPGVPEGAKG